MHFNMVTNVHMPLYYIDLHATSEIYHGIYRILLKIILNITTVNVLKHGNIMVLDDYRYAWYNSHGVPRYHGTVFKKYFRNNMLNVF